MPIRLQQVAIMENMVLDACDGHRLGQQSRDLRPRAKPIRLLAARQEQDDVETPVAVEIKADVEFFPAQAPGYLQHFRTAWPRNRL